MKKRVGITQRVVYQKEIDERRDVLDQRWQNFADEISVQLIPIPNNITDPVNYILPLNIEGIIFSGGNNIGISGKDILPGKSIQKDDVARERDQTERQLLKWAIQNKKPVIGVCRGLQFINAFYGGKQKKISSEIHVATTHQIDIIEKEWQQIFGSSIDANSYHNWGILKNTLAEELNTTAICGDLVEGFQSSCNKLFGIMWHPERYSTFKDHDIKLFKKIFSIV